MALQEQSAGFRERRAAAASAHMAWTLPGDLPEASASA